jgi:hypothetical protein
MSPGVGLREVMAYQAEWYGPGMDGVTARGAIERLSERVHEARLEGASAEAIVCTYVPREQAVLCVVRADSADVVAELGRQAGVPFDRIAEAVVLLPTEVGNDATASALGGQ